MKYLQNSNKAAQKYCSIFAGNSTKKAKWEPKSLVTVGRF